MPVALGLLETKGYVGAVTAADAMLKAGEVTLLGHESTGGGYVTVVIRGEPEVIEQAMKEGARLAERVGELISHHVIVEPHPELALLLPGAKR